MRRIFALVAVLISLSAAGQSCKDNLTISIVPSYRDSLSVDGPYILYTKAGVRVISVDSEGIIKDTTLNKRPSTVKVTEHEGRVSFDVELSDKKRQEWHYDKQPDRVFVMSDPHGRLDCVISLLKNNGVIDEQLRWKYGQDCLVMIGDIFDRGDDAVQIFWLFYKLQDEAQKAGGNVLMLLGNHEPMEFSGDMRYATPKYAILARELGIEYRTLFGSESELGRWISEWNTIGVIGRDLFVHAGLGGDFYVWNLPPEEVNLQMSRGMFLLGKERRAKSDTLSFLYGSYGPIWYRGLVTDNEKYRPIQSDTLDLLLTRHDVDHMIIGHTIHEDVSFLHDGKVICVNVNNAYNMEHNLGRALLIQDGKYTVVK